MKNYIDYVCLVQQDQHELGFLLTKEGEFHAINLIVVDHHKHLVRTICIAYTLEDAFSAAQDYIQRGIHIEGIHFTGIPEYSPV